MEPKKERSRACRGQPPALPPHKRRDEGGGARGNLDATPKYKPIHTQNMQDLVPRRTGQEITQATTAGSPPARSHEPLEGRGLESSQRAAAALLPLMVSSQARAVHKKCRRGRAARRAVAARGRRAAGFPRPPEGPPKRRRPGLVPGRPKRRLPPLTTTAIPRNIHRRGWRKEQIQTVKVGVRG